MWKIGTGEPIRGFEGHSGSVTGIDWSGDGRFLISGGHDHSLRYWDVSTGACLRKIDLTEKITAITISPDGHYCVAGLNNGDLELWAIKEREKIRTFSGHSDKVSSLRFTPGGERIFSASEDHSVRQWYLDWEPEILALTEWDESARPYLEVFLAQHTSRTGTTPEWSDRDFADFIFDLRNRGFGWIKSSGIRRQLKQMAEEWKGTTRIEARVAKKHKEERAITPKMKAAQKMRIRLGIAAMVIIVPLASFINHRIARNKVSFNDEQVKHSRQMIMHTIMPVPRDISASETCDPSQLQSYILRFSGPSDDPRDGLAARHCLEVISDPRSVKPILNMVRQKTTINKRTGRRVKSRVGSSTREEALSALTRMDDSVIPAIREGINDPDIRVRKAAVTSLSFRTSVIANQALITMCKNKEPAVRALASGTLREMISSPAMEPETALALLIELAEDKDVRVRLNTAEALSMLKGSKAMKLARVMSMDYEGEVAHTARAALSEMR